jgi:hypothetical protein
MVRFDAPVSACGSQITVYVVCEADVGMRTVAPKTANRRRLLTKARTPPKMARTLSIVETARLGISNRRISWG